MNKRKNIKVNGQWTSEHRRVAEQALGKPIASKHPVHHVDENPKNNVNNNLVVCEDAEYHFLLHTRMHALRMTGNPNAVCCTFCKKWEDADAPDLQKCVPPDRTGFRWWHVVCQRKYARALYQKKIGRALTTTGRPRTAPTGLTVVPAVP